MAKKNFDLNFRLVLISKTISVFGGNILGFAMILFLVDFTQSAAVLGMITAISQIPMIIATPFAGMIADRMNKRKLIIFFDVMTALSNFFFFWLLVTNSYTIFNITILRMFKMSINTFAITVFNAAVPRIVEEDQLISANGALQSIAALGLIGGSVVGGILFGIVDITTISFASGILFLVSAAISTAIKIPYERRPLAGSMIATISADMTQSFKFLKNEKPIIFKISLVGAMITLLFPPIFSVGLPFIVEVIFNQQVTLSFGIAAIGMLVGGISASKLTKQLAIKHLPKWVLAIGSTGLLLALAFSPLMPNLTLAFWLFNITLALLLMLFALLNSSLGAFIQKEVPAPLLGKVNSLLGIISLIAGPIGLFAVGLFIETTPLPLFFASVTGITVIVAIKFQRVLKKYFQNLEDETHEK